MIRIPNIEQIKSCEAHTIANKPISSIELMEVAAKACVKQIKPKIRPDAVIAVFCGMGNNGGDGLAITRLLCEENYNCVPYIIKHREEYSEECLHQVNLLKERNIAINYIEEEQEVPSCLQHTVIIDAIFGIGLNQTIDDPLLRTVVKSINMSEALVFAIDMPTGLLDGHIVVKNDAVVEANYTISFQFPKISFFLAENHRYVGEWISVNIELDYKYLNKIKNGNFLVRANDIKLFYRPRTKFAHKGNFGHGLMIAGSYGMMGASVLSSKAALRAGIGILTAHVPKSGYNIMQTTLPEALCHCDENEHYFTGIPFKDLDKYTAVAVGCGLGTQPETAQGLKQLIGDYKGSLVIDADAINILAENKTWLEFLPTNCIITPHMKEFERLTSKPKDGYERLEMQREFSVRHRCVVILKGACTSISTHQGYLYLCMFGNPGMAKGGSGDMLTGMLLALLAQGYTPAQAAMIGVYLHGTAADKAVGKQSYESLLSSDMIEYIGQAYRTVSS